MKKIGCSLLVVSLLLLSSQAEAQKANVKYRKPSETSGFVLSGPEGTSYLSVNPVTNREYITYLCWVYNVYKDYPEMFFRAFPGIANTDLNSIIGDEFDLPDDFRKIINASDLTSKYIFNPKYIDYPVMGLTWCQCMNYLAWITDRYNEQVLIRNKELNDDPNQVDENNFSFEAYISGQYEGVVRKLRPDKENGGERRSGWNDRIYFPAFRLPSESEMKTLKTSIKTSVIAYRPNPFLASWIDRYLVIRKDSMVIILNNNWPEKGRITFKPLKSDLPYKSAEAEYTFECVLKKNFSTVIEIYSALGQKVLSVDEFEQVRMKEKSNLGFLKFVIIGEDKDSNPVTVPRKYYDETRDFPVNTIFRYAVNAVR